MKTTLEIPDELFARARRHAARSGQPFRALVEQGLRLVLDRESQSSSFRLEDRRAGRRRGRNPLESLPWPDLRDEIYGGR